MITRRLMLALLLLALLPAQALRAEMVVIVSAQNPIAGLDRKELIDLYMGRKIHFPNGAPAIPLDQAAGSDARKAFYQALVGKSEASINAYWARLLFSGIASPPRVMPSLEATLQLVRENSAAITYADAADVEQDQRIRIVFRFGAAR